MTTLGPWTVSTPRHTMGVVTVHTMRGKQRQRRRGWKVDAYRRNPDVKGGFERDLDPHFHNTRAGAIACAERAVRKLNREAGQ